MLTELRIENFAIIDHLELSPGAGLLTFTGETGAGKSIILDALQALIGGRADAAMIRSGAERASLEATFRIPAANRAAIHELLQREDLLDDPDYVIFGRELRREGRSVARLNGRAVSLGLLRELGSFLIDIHGQSEHLSLLIVRQHLGLLDRYANSETHLQTYRQTYHQVQSVRRELHALRQSEQDATRRADLLAYQVQEIDSAHVRPGEEAELRQERERLANAESLATLAQQSLQLLDEGNPEAPSLTDLMGRVAQAMASLARIDAGQAIQAEQAEMISEALADMSRELRDYLERIEFNPRRLEQVEERLDVLHTLKRKYGGSLEAALAHADEARAQLEAIAHAGERIQELEIQLAAHMALLVEHGMALSQQRAAAARQLGQAVEAELTDLRMAGARFAVDMQFEPDSQGVVLPDGRQVAFDDTGFDRVEFLIAPNPGEGLKPLVKIASGGETSRLMLALKNVLARADCIPTLIFDEIDQGIGGRVGTVVGEKLWQLGRRHQVLCVTHLPQLAAYGDQHYRVRKNVADGRTTTNVEMLTGTERLDELALMLGEVTDANRAAARETLSAAERRRVELKRST